MERNWSEAAITAFECYPWSSIGERARALEEVRLTSFGDLVEVEDLPLKVRQWLKIDCSAQLGTWKWRGESWKELTEGFEREILSQALEAHGGVVAKAARALGTTARVVSYKAGKYGLPTNNKDNNNNNSNSNKRKKQDHGNH